MEIKKSWLWVGFLVSLLLNFYQYSHVRNIGGVNQELVKQKEQVEKERQVAISAATLWMDSALTVRKQLSEIQIQKPPIYHAPHTSFGLPPDSLTVLISTLLN